MMNFGLEIFAAQQTIETGAQNGHRTLQLMGSVGGIPCRSFQCFAGGVEGRFGTSPLQAVFLRVQRQLLYRSGEAGGDQMADDKTAESKQRAGTANLPAQPALLCDRLSERIKTDFVGRRKNRFRIEKFVEQKLRRPIYRNVNVVLHTI